MQRSAKLERVTFFSDAVFAIAMTLLVIDVRLPAIPNASENSLAQALVDLLPNYIGFAVSFLVIARFWIGHHRLLDMLATADPKLVRANLTLLLVIAFMPFPTAVLSNYALFRVAEGFYTAMLVLAGLANIHLIKVAFAHGRSSESIEAAHDEHTLRVSMWSPVVIGATGFVASMIRPVFGMAVLTVGSPMIMYLFAWRSRRITSADKSEAAGQDDGRR